ncbi:hypothetical protein RHMOL_Rhmol01G0089000 [Rhododendron molle]|uniref:Uncharacterized protein n=1 Tax=Rhododendron molle TaxID=49168 RepID=A0ACC0Q0Y5_RHOML|nr:hypothetical protein RHMOL_Rhmol01G0089000 [Rhododendron molle]
MLTGPTVPSTNTTSPPPATSPAPPAATSPPPSTNPTKSAPHATSPPPPATVSTPPSSSSTTTPSWSSQSSSSGIPIRILILYCYNLFFKFCQSDSRVCFKLLDDLFVYDRKIDNIMFRHQTIDSHAVTINLPKPSLPPGVVSWPPPRRRLHLSCVAAVVQATAQGMKTSPATFPGMDLGFPKSTFTYEELAMATDDFSNANLLGQGGVGCVHKRFVLPNGEEVAVK